MNLGTVIDMEKYLFKINIKMYVQAGKNLKSRNV